MDDDAAERYKNFARAYVRLVEELQHEGVPEKVARTEARIAAMSELIDFTYDEEGVRDDGPRCPMCGK